MAKTHHVKSEATSVKSELLKMLDGGQAHATFEQAVKGFPAELRGVVPQGLPYSAWQIVEHIRIAQRDILEFSDNEDGTYKPLKWPDSYWPKEAAPPSKSAWDESVAMVLDDRARFEGLIADASEAKLVEPFAWGDGQTLFREAMLIVDHAGYHVGELIVLRRLLGAWK
ncbi:DinB family protein [Granulicella sp. 5B5]|uniref:DinB family protein n=1 Tax=Granulicella sp. 5B5 TaxID=1617967 RepID=UPI0015F6D120|nr:DinB family protein [Granulicella sp. 5B5]QMV17338.1 DinB family protein [Granulicella sp. 5B5]